MTASLDTQLCRPAFVGALRILSWTFKAVSVSTACWCLDTVLPWQAGLVRVRQIKQHWTKVHAEHTGSGIESWKRRQNGGWVETCWRPGEAGELWMKMSKLE